MSNIKKALTPIDTEEIKPNLFIQKTKKGYRRVYPFVWDSNYRWREQFKTIFTFRTFFTLALIIFIAWSYIHDTKECFNVLEKINLLCDSNPSLCLIYNFTDSKTEGEEVIHEKDTNPLSIYSGEN